MVILEGQLKKVLCIQYNVFNTILMDYIDMVYEQSFYKVLLWEQIYSINVAELRTYKKVHCKSQQRESELCHSYQELDICRLHLHLE